MIACCRDDSITVWDVETGQEKHRLQHRSQNVANSSWAFAALAPDELTIAAGTGPTSVTLWNRQAGKQVQIPSLTHQNRVTAIQFSPDGHFVATATADGTVYAWSTADGRLAWKRKCFSAPVSTLSFAPSGRHLAAASAASRPAAVFSVLDFAKGLLLTDPVALPQKILSVFWIARNDALIVVTDDGVVQQWNLRTQDEASVIPHTSLLECTCLSGDGNTLATVDERGLCSIHRNDAIASSSEITTFSSEARLPKAIAVSPDGSKVAIADSRFRVRAFALPDHKEASQMDVGFPVAGIAFADGSRLLTTICDNGNVDLWNASTGERVHRRRLDLGEATVDDLDLEPTSKRCAVSGPE